MSSEEIDHSILTFDLKMLKHLEKTVGHEMIQFMIEQFLAYAPQQLQHLQESIQMGECEILRQQAHQFKGESLQIGANRLGALCNQLEGLAEASQLEIASAHLLKLQNEWLHLKAVLKQVNNDD
jgi:histidine phosphotransfer protein HptB